MAAIDRARQIYVSRERERESVVMRYECLMASGHFVAYKTWSRAATAAAAAVASSLCTILLSSVFRCCFFSLLLLLLLLLHWHILSKSSCCSYLHAKRFAAEVDKWFYFDFIAKNRWACPRTPTTEHTFLQLSNFI